MGTQQEAVEVRAQMIVVATTNDPLPESPQPNTLHIRYQVRASGYNL